MNPSADEYFSHLSNQSKERISKFYSREKVEFIRLINCVFSSLTAYRDKNANFDVQNPHDIAHGLMIKGANTLGAAFELSLGGYMWEPPSLLRTALESFAVGWDIVHNPSRFKDWNSAKSFASTHSMTNAKQAIPHIGQINGLLSKVNVHVDANNGFPAIIKMDKPVFQVFGFVHEGMERVRKPEVYLCLFVTYICLQLTEICFYKYCANPETLSSPLPNGLAKAKVSEQHKIFVNEMQSVFAQLAKDGVI